jgi:hypothetical protein
MAMTDQKRPEKRENSGNAGRGDEVPGQRRVVGESGPGVTQDGVPAGQNRRESARMVEPGDFRGRTPGQSESVMAVSSTNPPRSIARVDSDDNVGSETGATPGQRGTVGAKKEDSEKQRR